MDRADEAIGKENRLEAVSELSYRVEDWKGHKIDHFGELLLFGAYTVLKGEGAKEVEREVRDIFDSLDPPSRALIVAAGPLVPRLVIQNKYDAATLHAMSLWFIRNLPATPNSELHGIPEESEDGEQHVPLLLGTPLRRGKIAGMFKRTKPVESPKTLRSTPPQTPKSTRQTRGNPQSTTPENYVGNQGSPKSPESTSMRFRNTRNKTRERMGIIEPSGPAAADRVHLAESPSLLASTKASFLKKPGQFSPDSAKLPPFSPTRIPHWQENIYRSVQEPEHLRHFNGVFQQSTVFLFSHVPPPTLVQLPHVKKNVPCSPRLGEEENIDDESLKPITPTVLEQQFNKNACADSVALERLLNEQYKVYLFERILLCCKEINPNKPKNKMLSTTKPLLDRKGKPKLQLKGRIFMQNVTDVVTLNRRGTLTYLVLRKTSLLTTTQISSHIRYKYSGRVIQAWKTSSYASATKRP